MGSAPTRRDADTRLDSTFRRGAYVGPGMPGVYAVRHAGGSAPALAPVGPAWIQGDDYVLTLPISTLSGWLYLHNADPSEADETICGDLRDGISDSDPTASTGSTDPRMLVQFEPVSPSLLTVSVQQQAGQIAGAALISLFNAVTAGAYSHPTPPGGLSLEYETVDATVVSDLDLAADFRAGGDDPFDPGGSLYWSNEGVAPFQSVAHTLSDYTQLLTWPEQSFTADTVTIVLLDALGTTSAEQASRNVNLHVLSDALTNPGSAGRDPAYLTTFQHDAVMFGAEITVTVRPPRHRFVPS